tara:strand:+ start:11332 stop:11529 length:198 start_codon:yes stop_codon:yes gene_type:complete
MKEAHRVNESLLILEEENDKLRTLLKESRDFLAKIGTLKPIIMQECKDLIEKINKHRTYEHNVGS